MSEVKNKKLGRTPVSGSFHTRLLLSNNFDSLEFKEWIFLPAMLFGSFYKWWGNFGERQRPHEGLDLFLYRTKEGSIRHLSEGAKVPVAFEGQVVKISVDFLGKSVFVRHSAYGSSGSQLYTVYGHIRPGRHIRPGEKLNEGDIVGTIGDTRNSRVIVPNHLHLSVAWISNDTPVTKLGWQTINRLDNVVLIDPLTVISCPYSIVSDCRLLSQLYFQY